MSFYIYLTTAQTIVLAADNRKQVWTVRAGLEGSPRMEGLTSWNARKIHAVGFGWWMTGTGLSPFLAKVRNHARNLLEEKAREDRSSLEVTKILTVESGSLQRLFEETVFELTQKMRGGVEKPEMLENLQEIVFAGFDEAAKPVVLRARSVETFSFEVQTGAGILGFTGEMGVWQETVIQAIHGFLADVLRDLLSRPATEVGHRAWNLVPSLFQRMARSFPEKLSACGDLVLIVPSGHQWFLF
ncbi:MAG: hypothetical protein WHS46_01135 [Desulfosoma sp.]